MPALETARIRTTTINLYLKKRIEYLYPEQPLFATIRTQGSNKFNASGKEITWFPRIRRRRIVAVTAEQLQAEFQAFSSRIVCSLPWRHYELGERISEFEKLVNRGEQAIFKIVEEVVNELTKDFIFDLATKLVADASAAGSVEIAGFQTFMKQGPSFSNSPVRQVASGTTYAGLSCEYGALGGGWSGNFPFGSGDPEYHAFSPLIVDARSTYWGTSQTWTQTWESCLRFGATYLRVLKGVSPKVVVLDPELLRQAKDTLKSTYRLELARDSKLVSIGVKTLAFEDLELFDDPVMPANWAYMFDPKSIGLYSLYPDLIQKKGDDDITTQTDRILLSSWLQMVVDTPGVICGVYNGT
ncbi:MAG: hypothetical protein RML36_15340 [Anaerolineae bacterium]|nr:hypothetical protein [Anaerolineae bacterium]